MKTSSIFSKAGKEKPNAAFRELASQMPISALKKGDVTGEKRKNKCFWRRSKIGKKKEKKERKRMKRITYRREESIPWLSLAGRSITHCTKCEVSKMWIHYLDG